MTFPDVAPDLAEEPRWPLTGMQHPSLQPSFDVADALAEPGISWTDLCARNVDRRRDHVHHDELVYLAGWCAAARRDPVAAVGLLAEVRRSAVPGIARAVSFDIANIVVDSQDAEHADQILAKEQVRSAELYDVVAAAYFEIGRNDDAFRTTIAALQLDVRHDPAARCHRLARAALLGPKAGRETDVEELSAVANRKPPDPTCTELAANVACVVDAARGCDAYDSAHNIPREVRTLAGVAQRWDESRDWDGWMMVALDVDLLGPRSQTIPMLVAALDAAVVASECDVERLKRISRRVDRLFMVAHMPNTADKLAWVVALWKKPGECVRFRAQWLRDHPQ